MERVKADTEEKIELDLPLDDLDGEGESLSISVAGATKEDVGYILSQKHDLQVLDQELEDAQERGDDDQAERIANDYEQRVNGLTTYLKARGIDYRMMRRKDGRQTKVKPPKEKVSDKAKEKEKTGKEKEHRHYLKKSSQRSRGQQRTLERRKE